MRSAELLKRWKDKQGQAMPGPLGTMESQMRSAVKPSISASIHATQWGEPDPSILESMRADRDVDGTTLQRLGRGMETIDASLGAITGTIGAIGGQAETRALDLDRPLLASAIDPTGVIGRATEERGEIAEEARVDPDVLATATKAFVDARQKGLPILESARAVHEAFPEVDGYWGAMEALGVEGLLVLSSGGGTLTLSAAKRLPWGARQVAQALGLTLKAPLAAEDKVGQFLFKGGITTAKGIGKAVRAGARGYEGLYDTLLPHQRLDVETTTGIRTGELEQPQLIPGGASQDLDDELAALEEFGYTDQVTDPYEAAGLRASVTPRVYVPDDPTLYGEAFEKADAARRLPGVSAGRGDPGIRQPSGASVRGKPISPDDAMIPSEVYHVTTNEPAVMGDRILRAGGVGGLGGDERDMMVSFTIDRQIADQIADDLRLAVELSRMTDGRQVVRRLMDQAAQEGWEFRLGKRVLDDPEGYTDVLDNRPHYWMMDYFNERAVATGQYESFGKRPGYTGPVRRSPIFFTEDSVLAAIDPDNIAVITVPKESLQTGAMVTNFDVGMQNLEEIRVYGDVRVLEPPPRGPRTEATGQRLPSGAEQPVRAGGDPQMEEVLTTVEGVEKAIRQKTQALRDWKRNKRRFLTAGGKRKAYNDEVNELEQDLSGLEDTLARLKAEEPVEPGLAVRYAKELFRTSIGEELVSDINPRAALFDQEYERFLPEVLSEKGITRGEWETESARLGGDYLGVDATTRRAANASIATKMALPISRVPETTRTGGAPGTTPYPGYTASPERQFQRLGQATTMTADIGSRDRASTAMSKWNKVVNTFGDWMEDITGRRAVGPRRTPEIEGAVTTARRMRDQQRSAGKSQAAVDSAKARQGYKRVFRVGRDGLIQDENLQNVGITDTTDGQRYTLVSPTVQDIAARFNTYRPLLTEDQIAFMEDLRKMFEDGETTGVGRARVSKTGWNVILREGIDWDPNRIRPDIEKASATQRGGFYITRGITKDPTSGRTISMAQQVEDLFKVATMPTERGRVTAEMRSKRPAMGKLLDAEGNEVKRDTYDAFDVTVRRYINDVVERTADTRVKKKLSELAEVTGGTREARDWTNPYMQDAPVSDPLARAIQRELRGSKDVIRSMQVLKMINQIYRSLKATADFSALFIHGHAAAFRHPKIWWAAMKPSVNAMFRGEGVADELVATFDREARSRGLFDSAMWAKFGLRIGGAETEYAIPGMRRAMETRGVGLAPVRAAGTVLDRANVSFGVMGDSLRLQWAQNLLMAELRQGRTLQEVYDSGALREIANSANRMTGWSDEGFGGIGEALLFAPRFLRARIEQLVYAAEGAGRFAIGREQTRESKDALRSLMTMMGLAIAMTEITNHALGNETDRRPWVNGRPNPNFYTIRLLGQDYSLMGPEIGVFHAVSNLLNPAGSWDQNVLRAYRSLSSGLGRIFIDNMTGYTFKGEQAPIGVFRKDPDVGLFSGWQDVAEYLGELSIPIAPQQIWEQGEYAYEGLVEGRPGAVTKAIGMGIASFGEVVGGRVSPVSWNDVRDQIARERYGEAFDDLNRAPQIVIDEAVREELGDSGRYLGPQGYLRRQVDEANDELIEATTRISEESLSGPIGTRDNNPKEARNKLKEAIRIHRSKLYGSTWNPETRRMEGGIYDDLYPEEREAPEEGDRGYLAYLWGQTFDQATDEAGKIDFEELNLLQSEFWDNVPSDLESVNAVLENIRLLEPRYDPKIQKMIDAGRYAGAFNISIQGVETSYFELKKHPVVVSGLSRASGYSEEEVREYLSLSSAERNARKDFPREKRIARALGASERSGLLNTLKVTFVNTAPGSWKQAMLEAGYEHKDDIEMLLAVKKQVTGGRSLPSLDYESLYMDELKPEISGVTDLEPKWGTGETVLWPGVKEPDPVLPYVSGGLYR